MASDAPAPPAPGIQQLTRVLVRARVRHARSAWVRGAGGGTTRLYGAIALVVPAAYLGLFVTAWQTLRELAPAAVLGPVLGLVTAVIVTASGAAKVATGGAVLAGSSENELFLTRPVSLARLVVARSLAGVVTDVFDVLFLLPVLMAAALSFGLGALGVATAVATSAVVQVTVSAAAQAVQIALVRVVPARQRRWFWTGAWLVSAAAIASLWMVASAFLRRPEALVAWMAPHVDSPVGRGLACLSAPLMVAPGAWVAAARGVLWLLVLAAVAVATAAGVAAAASRQGWEEAGAPWAEQRAGSRRHLNGPPLSILDKELRLLVRDRTRLLALLAMPVIFVGVQIFGAAGWGYTTASTTRIGMLAFSLAAYLATIGPLRHMDSERNAFWILRVVPVPLGRVMAEKALAWSLLVGALALAAMIGLTALSERAFATADIAGTTVLVMGGAVSVVWLAVAMGCEGADLSRDGRPAVGVGSIYVFLLVAGLYNIVLLERGALLWRGGVLYLAAVACFWTAGIKRAELSLDAAAMAAPRLSPGAGAVAAVLAFLGARAAAAGVAASGEVPAREVPLVSLTAVAGWIAIVATLAGLSLRNRRARSLQAGRATVARVGAVLLGGAVLAVVVRALGMSGGAFGGRAMAIAALVIVGAEEVIFRGLLQGGLEATGTSVGARPTTRTVVGAALISAVVSVAGSSAAAWSSPLLLVLTCAAAAVARAVTGRALVAVLVRVLAVAVALERVT